MRFAVKARFRRNAFGWRSGPAIQRVREAEREIRNVARKDPVLAGKGAVLFLERFSPALERVDSSSGALGTAVNRAIDGIVPIIAGAPGDTVTREAWLERLFEAHAANEIPYIESLADHWGELCASRELASAWADRLLDITRLALSADRSVRGHFHGSMACLSALYRAGCYQEIVELVEADLIWPYKFWGMRALAAMGRKGRRDSLRGSVSGPTDARPPPSCRVLSILMPCSGEGVSPSITENASLGVADVSYRPYPVPRVGGTLDRLRYATRSEVFGKLVRQIALADRLHRPLQIVVESKPEALGSGTRARGTSSLRTSPSTTRSSVVGPSGGASDIDPRRPIGTDNLTVIGTNLRPHPGPRKRPLIGGCRGRNDGQIS